MKLTEYKQLFLNEAEEILNKLNNILVELEKKPSNLDLINELFRQSHTLKSMAQSMEYEKITKLTHSMEAALMLLRSGKQTAKKATVETLFQSVDILSDLIEEVRGGETKEIRITSLVKKFEEMKSEVEKRSKSARNDLGHSPSSLSETQSVRVPLIQLDNLMDLTGELVINKVRLTQITQTLENNTLEEAVGQMSRLTAQLQEQMINIRLVPLEYIFTPYPRMVRDMASDQGKEVDLFIEGGEIGLDRSIQDEINEPLLHLLKNAVTHGIEEPNEREKLKKPKRGKIRLTARRERNFVVIELFDDGRGMEAAGRGVGLNVAKVKVESFGGTLDIDSRPNKGTTVLIKLPLTMVIVQAMLVGIENQTFCIPLSYITETIKISPREIKTMENHKMISYRNTALALIGLREKLGFPPSIPQPQVSDKSTGFPTIPVVVVEVGSKKAGLVVDTLLGQQEVVIKPMTGILKRIKGDITIPNVLAENFAMVPDILGGSEKVVTGIHFSVEGQINGNCFMLFSQSDSLKLVEMLTGQKVADIESLDEMGKSALQELGNVITGSYLRVLAQELKIKIKYSVPGFVHDMLGAILEQILAHLSLKSQYAIIIESEFVVTKEIHRGKFVIIMSLESVGTIIQGLGKWGM
jgi:two-component system chemotaxis sensor kinase CheA